MSNPNLQASMKAFQVAENWIAYQRDYVAIQPLSLRGISLSAKDVTRLRACILQLNKNVMILERGLKSTDDGEVAFVFRSLIKQTDERAKDYEKAANEISDYLKQKRSMLDV